MSPAHSCSVYLYGAVRWAWQSAAVTPLVACLVDVRVIVSLPAAGTKSTKKYPFVKHSPKALLIAVNLPLSSNLERTLSQELLYTGALDLLVIF